MKSLLTIIISCLLFSGFAQEKKDSDWRVYSKYKKASQGEEKQDSTSKAQLIKGPGEITISEDPRITELVERYNSMDHVQQGFRVQIYLGNRAGQGKARTKFQELYPQYYTYLDYQAPNFKVRVGDFKKRADAERLLLNLRSDFPGAYIVPDVVELNRIP